MDHRTTWLMSKDRDLAELQDELDEVLAKIKKFEDQEEDCTPSQWDEWDTATDRAEELRAEIRAKEDETFEDARAAAWEDDREDEF